MPSTHRDLDRACAALLRAGAHQELEMRLAAALSAMPGADAIREAALALTTAEIGVAGWESLNTTIAVLSRQRPIVAIGVDLTAHGEGETPEGWRVLPLETSYYADTRAFGFSQATPDALRRACAASTPPWVGDFVKIDATLTITGAHRLHDAIARCAENERHAGDPGSARAQCLGSWVRHLRVHQALKRAMDLNGLARPIPMIVGSNDLAPYVTVPYWTDRVVDCEAQADEAIAARTARNAAHYRTRTEETIAEWRERRDLSRRWPRSVNPRQRETHLAYARAHETVQRRDHPELQGLPYSFEGDEADFAYLAALYRHLRDATVPRPPTPSRKTWRTILFGR